MLKCKLYVINVKKKLFSNILQDTFFLANFSGHFRVIFISLLVFKFLFMITNILIIYIQTQSFALQPSVRDRDRARAAYDILMIIM